MRKLCVCGCIAHARGPHLHNKWNGANRETFLHKILSETQKFSAIHVRYIMYVCTVVYVNPIAIHIDVYTCNNI